MRLMLLMLLTCVGCGPYYLVSEVPSDTKLVSTPVETLDDLPLTDGCCGDDCQCCDRCPCRDDGVKSEPKTEKQPAEIVCYTMDGCAPCKAWNAPGAEADQLRAVGWTVRVVDHGRGQAGWTYPTYRIKHRGVDYGLHAGFMPHSRLKRIIGK